MTHRGHNEGTIYPIKDKDGNVIGYRAQLTVPGSGRRGPDGKVRLDRRSFTGKTKKAVRQELEEAKSLLLNGRLGPRRSQTVGDYLDSWLKTAGQLETVKHNTLASYALNVRRLREYIGQHRLDLLKPAHVQDAYTEMSAKGLAPNTVRQAHRLLHKALEDALRLDLVSRNVSEATQRPRVKTVEMNWFTADQLARLFAATEGERLHALWVILGTTGLRLGEALGLKWSDINLPAATLTVHRILQRDRIAGCLVFSEPKTESSRRTVDLPARAVSALSAHRERQAFERKTLAVVWQEHGLVFPSEIGTPLEQSRVTHRWRNARLAAGVPPYRIHDLRHTVATHLLSGGMQPHEVARVLGHTSPALVLKVYGHVIPSSQQRAAGIMEQLLQGASR